MEIAEVQDRESLERYLVELPKDEQREVSLRVAFRAAARVLPDALLYVERHPDAKKHELTSLSMFSNAISANSLLYLSEVALANGATIFQHFADTLLRDDYDRLAASAVGAAAFTAYSASGGTADSFAARAAAESAGSLVSSAAFDIWPVVRADLRDLEEHVLWPNGVPKELVDSWIQAKTSLLTDTNADWSFWMTWYERVLAGRDTLPDALAPIFNRLTEEDWDKGPAHINPMFDDVLAMYRADDARKDVRPIPQASDEMIQSTKVAMVAHRKELPATSDAILGLIALEIERLQTRNYVDDDHKEECVRQIAVLTTLHKAVSRLLLLVPTSSEMPEVDAEQAAGLAVLYLKKFREWPRANADELVDNTYRLGLIGATAALLPMVGITANAAAIAGAALFGGKKIMDGAKAAKGLIGGKE